MTSTHLVKKIKMHLLSKGFSSRGNAVLNVKNEIIYHIHVQKSRYSQEHTINIGISPSVIKNVYETAGRKNFDVSCYPISIRIGSLIENLDKWYRNDEIECLIKDIDTYVFSFFNNILTIDDIIEYVFINKKYRYEIGLAKISIYLLCLLRDGTNSEQMKSHILASFDDRWKEILSDFVGALELIQSQQRQRHNLDHAGQRHEL